MASMLVDGYGLDFVIDVDLKKVYLGSQDDQV